MVYGELDNLTGGKSEPPTSKCIEEQRRRQLDVVLEIRRLLAEATRRSAEKAA